MVPVRSTVKHGTETCLISVFEMGTDMTKSLWPSYHLAKISYL